MAANFLDQLLRGGSPQRPAMYPREDNLDDQFALMNQAGWFGGGEGGVPVATEFDPMATDSRLGNAPQVAKEKNALNALFQGAIYAGDLDKASRLAVTPEQQAMLDVAYGQRMNRQAGGQGNLMADYQRAQDTALARSRMEEDRLLKIRQMNDASNKTRAETTNLQIKDPAAADWSMGPSGMYNKRTGEAKPLPNGGIKLGPGEKFGNDGSVQLVPGTAAYLKQANAHAKDYGLVQAVETKTDNAIKKIDEILDPKNESAFNNQFGGYNAYVTKLLPGETQDMGARIDSLKANMKTAGLELIRAGGSIGQMTEREWPIVQDQLDKLDPKMGKKAARDAFNNIKANFERIRNNAREVYATEWGNTQFAKNGAQDIPSAAIQHLKANPQLRTAFDMKYGQGASAKILGQ